MADMASFAPVYRPPSHHQSFLARQQTRLCKRKRDADDSDEDNDVINEDDDAAAATDLDHVSEPGVKDEPKEATSPRVPHPVNRSDPFYVAGLAREDSLPGGHFPHAPLPEARPKLVVEQELARLNPPVYVPSATPDTEDGSLRRRHLDNLTTILHKCMLTGDWVRASRAWGLILRTEIQGRGIDARHNGHWLVGGEILMRRTQRAEHQGETAHIPDSVVRDEEQQADSTVSPAISDEGFRLAREYYDRLTLQYPHMPRQSHAIVNALAIYPALFNVWIFEVQDRALRARRQLRKSSAGAETDSDNVSSKSEPGEPESSRGDLQRIAALELEQAIPIAQRMDDIMLNPPYDQSRELLRLRSMVSLWLSDLYQRSTRKEDVYTEEDHSVSDLLEVSTSQPRQNIFAYERGVAERIRKAMMFAEIEIPGQLQAFLADAEQYQEDDG